MGELRMYTISEVAEILRVTRRTVYAYIRDGKLKAVKVGKYWRVTEKALEELLSPLAEA